jgi:tetratricopeptide (TPR) repeat protein
MSAKHRAKARTRRSQPPPGGRWRAAALILIVGALTYANSLSAPFIFDDDAVVVENATIQSPSLVSSLLNTPHGGAPTAGRPLANLSFAVSYAIGGLDVRAYHAFNVGLHLICALLLFAILRRTLARSGEQSADAVALVCSLVWMVHPLQSEVVDYISARTESLMALFFLLTLYCSIRAHDARTQAVWQVGAVTACALGTLCKESMAAALPMVILYDRTFLFSSWRQTARSRWPLYLGLAGTWVELAWLVSSVPRGSSAGWSPDPGLVTPVTPWVYLLNQAVMIVRYLRLTFWPSAMVLDYGVPRALTLVQVVPQMAVVSLLGLLTLVALVRAPAIGFLGAWFFVTLAPSSSIVPIHTEAGSERRMYLASIAIVVLIVVLVHRGIERRVRASSDRGRTAKVLLATALAVVAGLAAATIARNAEYASPLTMWRTVVDRWPNGRARWALATQLKAAGRTDEVLPLLREAVADFPDAHRGVGEELFAEKKYSEAVDELDTFVRMRPMHVNVLDAHELAGRALAAQGKADEAVARFRLLLKMVPTYAAAHGRLGDVYFQQQRFAEAAPEYAAFLAARVGEAGPWTNYGISLFETGRGDDAVKAFARAAALEPRSVSAHRNLANAMLAQHEFAGAAHEAREALRIDARDEASRAILARALTDKP